MIDVTFVSLCQNEAHKTYSQILDRFAVRIGEKTWFTKTVYNVLNEFIKLLKDKSDDDTSIAVYVHNKKGTRIYDVIGKNLFNMHNNSVPVSYSQKIHYHLKNENKILNFVEPVLFLSALLHDIGKNNFFFQKKIREKHSNTRDVIRHDFASFIILSNQNLFNMLLENNLKGINLNDEEYLNYAVDYLYELSKKDVFTLKDAVYFTVLTHHKNFLLFPKKKRYLKREIIENYTDGSDKESLVFNNFDFSYIEKLEEYFNIYKDDLNIQIDRETFTEVYLFAKTLLMFADHYASTKKLTGKITDNMVLANKQQRLESHLLEVLKESRILYNEFLIKNYVKKTKINLSPSKIEKFLWQDKTAEFIKNNLDSKKDVMFVVNNAETGSGKTIGNVKILNAFNDKNRFNFLFPMRNLSIQTFDVFANELNIDKDDLALVIGYDESENSEQEEKTEEKITEYLYTEALRKQYDRNRNYKDLFEKPVVVGTFDYLMKASENKKSKYLLPFIRLFTSDLIIDEIDNFNIEDLKAVTRFFYLAGTLGKNVVLSSATLTCPLINVFLTSYKKGFECFNKNNAKTLKILGCNNITEPCFLNSDDDIKEFLNSKNRVIKESESKVNFSVKKEFDVNDITESIYQFHKDFAQSYKDKKISMGFVKFYHLSDLFKNYLKFLKHIEENTKKNYKILTMLFHSTDFESVKKNKEELLYSILQKKDKKYLDNFYELVKNHKEENIIFVLFTTPIIEVGKDFDFDFGISEYTSLTDIIQTAGRVRRHRNQRVQKNNFIIFFNEKNNFKFLDSEKEEVYKTLESFEKKKIDTSLLFDNQIAEKETLTIKDKLQESLDYTNESNCVLGCNHLYEYPFRKSITRSETYIVKKDKKFYLNREKGAGFYVKKLEKEVIFDFEKYLLKSFEIDKNDTVHVNFYNNEDLNDFAYSNNFGLIKKTYLV